MTVFFNTEIRTGSLLENLGNFCFLPVRTLGGGKTYVQVDSVFLSEERGKPHIIKRIVGVALSIIFLVPGIILGTLFKGLSYLNASVRQSARDFKRGQKLMRVLMENDEVKVRLHGNPKELNPAYEKKEPYNWLETHVLSPRKMDLRGLKPEVAERFFDPHSTHDFSLLKELDISHTGLVHEQIKKIVKRCPNLEILRVDGLEIKDETVDVIKASCQILRGNKYTEIT